MPRRRARARTRVSLLLLAALLALYAISFLRAGGGALVTARTDATGTTLLRTRMLLSDSGGIVLREQVGISTNPAVAANVAREMPRGWSLRFGSDRAGNLWSRQWTLVNILWFDSEWNTAATAAGRYATRGVRVPYWAPALAAAAPPLLATLRRRRRDRVRHDRLKSGRCPACGYDLRSATGQCPECGTIVPNSSPSPAPP